MSDTPSTRNKRKIQIWQQNLNRSLEGQLDLLHSLKASNYDIMALQEPHIDFLGRTRTSPYWTVIYPKLHVDKPKKTRSVILINRNISTNNWEDLGILSSDVTGVHLHGTFRAICLLNVYNDCKHNGSLTVVEEQMRKKRSREEAGNGEVEEVIWLGDFNRHHTMWDEERNAHIFTKVALEATQPLLDMISKHNMHMALPKDIPTLEACSMKNHMRVDNVFCSMGLHE